MPDLRAVKQWTKGFALLMVLASVASTVQGQDKHVVKNLTVLGTAIVSGENLAASRENAVNDALVAAVGQVVVEMLTGETVVRRFKLINDNILAQPDNYILNYRVLTDSVTGSAIRTLVQVDIAAERISRDLSRLGLAMSGTEYPRVLFMLAESTGQAGGPVYWWGQTQQSRRTISGEAMAGTFRSIGFDIVDPPELSTPLDLPPNPPEAQLIALAKQLGADVVVAGNGSATAAANTMGGSTGAFEGVVEARAFSVQTGRQMGRSRQSTVISSQNASAGAREALKRAGVATGDDLGRQVMIAWQEEQDRSALIEVAVEGTGGHIASFVRLRTAIGSISGVNELKMQEMSTDRAVMVVNYQGNTRSLADALLLKTFDGFGIDIYEVTADAVRIRLVTR